VLYKVYRDLHPSSNEPESLPLYFSFLNDLDEASDEAAVGEEGSISIAPKMSKSLLFPLLNDPDEAIDEVTVGEEDSIVVSIPLK
jgi:hypothetical protein